ncbi:helix-turn-helix transcriptional regulator [Puia sp.]|jgi:AraC-like DNA-binding protein|uniref:AraC family transcriptional regulator n=1 Tax=Puia sp. TaxID=2045100 RepID=UPI002F3E2019
MKAPDSLPIVYATQNAVQSFAVRTLESLAHYPEPGQTMAYSNSYFEIFWITRGAGLLRLDLRLYAIGDNHLFCARPGEMHELSSEEGLEGYVISFTKSFPGISDADFDLAYPGGIYSLFERCRALRVRSEYAGDMAIILEKLLKEYDNADLFRQELLKRYFKIFLIYLGRQFDTTDGSDVQARSMGLVQKFMETLNTNFKTKRMVAEYARELAVTPNYLNETVKKATGYPASHHIRQRIALEAKRRAAYSDVCMKEIAYYLGFSDSAHFSKFFKNTTGMNFSDFKKEKFSVAMAS